MKNLIVCLISLLTLPALQAQERVAVRVKNPSAFARPHETIQVQLKDLQSRLGIAAGETPAVAEGATPLAAQATKEGELLFQAGFAAGEEKEFTITKASPPVPVVSSQVQAKYILPRKDVAWENDRIAFRIYGGPLAGNVRSGLDVWVKRVPYEIIDKWYDGDSLKGKARISYHIDHGEGADMFDVGRSLGAGGNAILLDGVPCQPGMFATQFIRESGPIRADFTVTYTVDSCGTPFTVEQRYTLDRGENLNKIEVSYRDVGRPFQIVAGLVRRANTADTAGAKGEWIALWGPVNADSTNGSLGTGIVLPGGADVKESADHAMLLAPPGDRLVYYAGAGWTRGGDFPDKAAWCAYLARFADRLREPLQVTVK